MQHEEAGRSRFKDDIPAYRRDCGILSDLLDPVSLTGRRAEHFEDDLDVRSELLSVWEFRAGDQGIRVANLGPNGSDAKVGSIIGTGRAAQPGPERGMDVRGHSAVARITACHSHWLNTVELVAPVLGAGPAQELLDRPGTLQGNIHRLVYSTGRHGGLVLHDGEAGNPAD